MRLGSVKSTNSRERSSAACTICELSADLASDGSACRLSLVWLAGFEMRPSMKRSSRLNSTRRVTSAAFSTFLMRRNIGTPSAARRLDLPVGQRAVERVRRGDHARDRLALLRRQPRIPDVADEDVARLVAVVPGLVLD